MKKIIYLIVLLLIPIKVYGKEVVETRQYRHYYLEKEYSTEFYEKGKNNPEYPNIAEAWHYSNEIQTSLTKPDKEKNIVEEIPIIHYQEHKKVRYIMIDNIYSSANSKINLAELMVKKNNEKIPITIRCDRCSNEFFAKIQNSVTTEYNYIENYSQITVDLRKEYFADDLTIEFYTNNPVGQRAKMRVTINNTEDISDVYYRYVIDEALIPYLKLTKDFKNVEHEERLEAEIKQQRGIESIENAKIIKRQTEYRYQNKVYQYYKEIKHYIDGYYQNIPGLIKDETQFIEKDEESTETHIPTIEYVEKKVEVPVLETITEYIEKKVPVNICKVERVPIITEKIQYKDKIIEKKVPVEAIVEKKILQKEKSNYPLQYVMYLSLGIILKKLSFFAR